MLDRIPGQSDRGETCQTTPEPRPAERPGREPGDLDGYRGRGEVVEQAKRVSDPDEPGDGPCPDQAIQRDEPSQDNRGRGQGDGMQHAAARRRAKQTQTGRAHPAPRKRTWTLRMMPRGVPQAMP